MGEGSVTIESAAELLNVEVRAIRQWSAIGSLQIERRGDVELVHLGQVKALARSPMVTGDHKENNEAACGRSSAGRCRSMRRASLGCRRWPASEAEYDRRGQVRVARLGALGGTVRLAAVRSGRTADGQELMLEPRGPRPVSVDRTTIIAVAAFVAASAVAWVALVTYEPPMGFLGFTVGWSLMMAAMMLPSIAPLLLLSRGSRVGMAVGYLAVWTVVGLVPYVAMERAMGLTVPVVLGVAGLYELSPLKSACLRRCRNPAAFLMEHYRSGAVRLGIEHGIWCLGCCVGLMAVLVLAASMQLGWAIVIAGAVFVQKVLPYGEVSARLIGVGLLVAAAAVALT